MWWNKVSNGQFLNPKISPNFSDNSMTCSFLKWDLFEFALAAKWHETKHIVERPIFNATATPPKY